MFDNAQEVLDYIEKEDVVFIDIRFTDLPGVQQHFNLPAASLDDVAAQSAKAGTKALGIVIDDTAVTPRYVVGFAAARELPIIGRIALGSLKNKFLFLLPGALALSYFAPFVITPLLMLGGLYLCYEGAEKVYEALFPHHAHQHEHEADLEPGAIDPAALEKERIDGAIQTDFILSAEIMTIALAALPEMPFLQQAVVLALVGPANPDYSTATLVGLFGVVFAALGLLVAGVVLVVVDKRSLK